MPSRELVFVTVTTVAAPRTLEVYVTVSPLAGAIELVTPTVAAAAFDEAESDTVQAAHAAPVPSTESTPTTAATAESRARRR